MDEDELLAAYGTRPPSDALPRIRELLDALTRQGAAADTLSMRLLCVHLFNAASVDDVLLIWRAKESSWDAHAAIDVQLLCGAGLDATKGYLGREGSDEARAALDHIAACEAAGDFDEFDPKSETAHFDHWYGSEAMPDDGAQPPAVASRRMLRSAATSLSSIVRGQRGPRRP
jgi:hypothetical protein